MRVRAVVVTGAASGIGRACAESLAAAPTTAHLFVLDMQATALDTLARELRAAHAPHLHVHALVGDVSSSAFAEHVAHSVRAALAAHSVPPPPREPDSDAPDAALDAHVHVLVHAAGVQPPASACPLHELSEALWDRVLAVNVKAAFLLNRALLPMLLAAGRSGPASAVIVHVSSVQALASQTCVPAYAASKGALNALTRAMALDYAPHVRVLALCPGAVDTPLHRAQYQLASEAETTRALEQACGRHPFGRAGQPDEIGRVCAFLCSDDASFMSGSEVVVDGALLARGAWAAQRE